MYYFIFYMLDIFVVKNIDLFLSLISEVSKKKSHFQTLEQGDRLTLTILYDFVKLPAVNCLCCSAHMTSSSNTQHTILALECYLLMRNVHSETLFLWSVADCGMA